MLILKQYSWFYSHLGLCSLGGTLRHLIGHFPQVFVYHLLLINCIPFLLQTSHHDRLCLLLSGIRQVGEGDGLTVGEHHHLPPTTTVPHTLYNSSRAVLPYQPQGLGEKQKICHNIAFLLILAEEEATGDRRYGLLTTWVNPCQARVCSMEEAVRELATSVSSGPDWPYALLQLHEDTCHVQLPKEGYLCILPQGGAEMTACGRISQLEVCQLLISSLQVAYPVGLNECEEPIITSLPESLANGISLTRGKSIYLEIDIPQSMAEEPDWKASPIGKCSTIIIARPHKTTTPKSEGEVSMTMEVRSLLSWVMFDTSGHGSGNSTPRRLNPVVVLTPPPHKLKELPKLVDTSSQVSSLNDVKMAEASLEGFPTTISPIAKTTRSRSITPPADMADL